MVYSIKLHTLAQRYVEEFIKCKSSFDYFCRNYVFIELPGQDEKLIPYRKQTELIDLKENVIQCFWKNMVPQKDNKQFWKNTYAVEKSLIDVSNYDLSKWHLYNFLYPKVIHKAKGFKSIAHGNHDVKIKRKKVVKENGKISKESRHSWGWNE